MPDEMARKTAIARPERPIDRKAATVPRRSIATTSTNSAISAKNDRPATCVAGLASSSRCASPAVDQATAATRIASCP